MATLSDMTGKNMISIRSEALKGKEKSHGISKPIMGKYQKGQVALLLDDVVASRARTKNAAIMVLKEAGLVVCPRIYVIGDREEGGREILARDGWDLFSILRFKKMLRGYRELKQITEDMYVKSLAFARISKRLALK